MAKEDESESSERKVALRRQLGRLSTFVLAGGRGERLHPLTKDRAKPAVVFGGIYRIIDFVLSNCVNSGIRRINVLTQYKSISLARHIKLGWNILPAELMEFIDVIPAQQRYGEFWYRGTADAIFQNIYTLEREESDHVLVLAGDHIYRMDYLKMFEFHLQKGADLTVAAVETSACESRHFGVLEVNQESGVLEFKEKPKESSSIPGKPGMIYASMGIYIFKKEVLLEELMAKGSEGRHDFGRHILPKLVGKRSFFAYPFVDENRKGECYWRDIGTLDAFYDANMDLVSVNPQFNLYDTDWPIRTHQGQYPPAKTVFAGTDEGRRGEAVDSLISSGCIISGGKVERSILSPRVRINSYASVEESVLMDGVDVGRRAKIRKVIIDKYVQILPETRIGYELENDRRRFTVTDSNIIVIPRGRIIGPDSDLPRWQNLAERSQIDPAGPQT